ncbi:Bax inhibitor-1/YccA family protein [Lacibacterium aquatile]|uniref:Bax inhibitor-1/YccA family protein n=1 Tax=Lacibacterium aquatile TaxID=1168082 RepID=A0ABW5DRM3_9PROT
MAQGWQTPGWQTGAKTIDRAEYDAGLRTYMQRVFGYMAAALVITGIVAFFVGNSPALLQTLFATPLKWVVMLAPLGVVLLFSAGINRMSFATAQAVFWGFAGLMGLSISFIFAVYTGASIGRVFFITAGMFLSAALYGYTTKRDLATMGGFLMMGAFGLVIASVVNIFLGSTQLQWIVSVLSVVIFTGLTAWDTQNLKESYNESLGGESLGKMALMGALSLYLNFINIFMSLLRLMGNKE